VVDAGALELLHAAAAMVLSPDDPPLFDEWQLAVVTLLLAASLAAVLAAAVGRAVGSRAPLGTKR
jgi:hypothetical protein